MPAQEPAEKWYYDACTLDASLESLDEIINKRNFHKAYTSNLAIGEACANCFNTNDEQFDAFVDLIRRLRGYIEIVNNDGVEEIVAQIKVICSRISFADRIHLATALREKCCNFRTIDKDFTAVTRRDCEKLAHQYGINRLSITLMNLGNKRELFKAKKAKYRQKKDRF